MLVTLICLVFLASFSNACERRQFQDGIVCVCNSASCDTIPETGPISGETLKVLYTSPADPGINYKEAAYSNQQNGGSIQITVDSNEKYQKILGFGGAFTDSASDNILRLSQDLQQKLLSSYFGAEGIEYNMCRVPIGACDFSPRMYTMDDDHDGDVNLDFFSLQTEDLNWKIPVIRQALNLRAGKQLNLFGSAWTPPTWMKTHPVWYGGSRVNPAYYDSWANYHIKFFDEYAKQGVNFWGLTVGNEPLTGFMRWTQIPSVGWTTTDQATFIKEHLGPALKASSHSDVKVMILDDSLNVLPFMVPPLLNDYDVLQYVDGVAVHWYQDGNYDPAVRLLATKNNFKEIFALKTETCHFITAPVLGSWPRAADYIDNIMTDLQYGYGGWIEWNLALNSSGGFSQINLPADAPIVINDDWTEFYKQPTFYVLGHFSKYVLPDSVRIGAVANGNVKVLAFLRTDNVKVVSVYNAAQNAVSIQINDGAKISAPIDVPAQSINTILYQ